MIKPGRRTISALGSDPRWLEMASGAAAVGWGGIVLFAPGSVEWPSLYADLSAFIGPRILGLLLVIIGLLQAAAVRLDHQIGRIPFAAAAAAVWLLVAYSLLRAPMLTPSVAPAIVLGVADLGAALVLISLYHRARALP